MIIVFIAILLMAYLVFQGYGYKPVTTWILDNASHLSFDNREPVGATTSIIDSSANDTVEKVVYKSFGEDVYALLRTPKNVTKPPVVVVLPAASINKEADADMAKALASWGYASLTLDERGNNGETAGPSAMDYRAGYQALIGRGNPVQYKQVSDVLQGYEYVKTRPDLNGDNVAVLGESMGGRFAIISAALEPELKGAFVVSSGPYGLGVSSNPAENQFITSIEPGSYLSQLPPGKLVMIHFTEDPIIPIAQGRSLYYAAGEPKAWYEYNGSVHGVYSAVYGENLRSELKAVLG